MSSKLIEKLELILQDSIEIEEYVFENYRDDPGAWCPEWVEKEGMREGTRGQIQTFDWYDKLALWREGLDGKKLALENLRKLRAATNTFIDIAELES